jgi:hypothetical protein
VPRRSSRWRPSIAHAPGRGDESGDCETAFGYQLARSVDSFVEFDCTAARDGSRLSLDDQIGSLFGQSQIRGGTNARD